MRFNLKELYKYPWCFFGLHDWYKGYFAYPVWGRWERHCLCCDKKQYLANKPLTWVEYEK